jgi:hypothetical protein
MSGPQGWRFTICLDDEIGEERGDTNQSFPDTALDVGIGAAQWRERFDVFQFVTNCFSHFMPGRRFLIGFDTHFLVKLSLAALESFSSAA